MTQLLDDVDQFLVSIAAATAGAAGAAGAVVVALFLQPMDHFVDVVKMPNINQIGIVYQVNAVALP